MNHFTTTVQRKNGSKGTSRGARERRPFYCVRMEQKREGGNPNLASGLADNEASGDLSRRDDLEAEADEVHTLGNDSHQIAPILSVIAAIVAAAEHNDRNLGPKEGSVRSPPRSFRWIRSGSRRRIRSTGSEAEAARNAELVQVSLIPRMYPFLQVSVISEDCPSRDRVNPKPRYAPRRGYI